MTPRRAAEYVHGLDGPVVVVPAAVAVRLIRAAGLDQLRVSDIGLTDPELYGVLVALRTAALAVAPGGQIRAPTADTRAPSALMTTRQAAALLDLSVRAVRRRAAAGRLPARRDPGGRWVIDPAELKLWKATG